MQDGNNRGFDSDDQNNSGRKERDGSGSQQNQ